MIFRFSSGSLRSGERAQKLAARIFHLEGIAAVPENAPDEIGLSLAHQARVHVNAPHPRRLRARAGKA